MEERRDSLGKGGNLRFNGKEVDLSVLDRIELMVLEEEIREDRLLLIEMLKREDLERDMKEEGWKQKLTMLIGIRKLQLRALQKEFIKRKKFTRTLESFAFASVYEIYGKEGLREVKQRAQAMQQEHIASYGLDSPVGKVLASKKTMCAGKVAHPGKQDANFQIESLKARGKNTQRLNAYLCPYCNKWHIGHRPKGGVWNLLQRGGGGNAVGQG